MATVDAVAGTSGNPPGSTLSWTHVCGSGADKIVIFGSSGSSGSQEDPNGATFNGVACTAVIEINDGAQWCATGSYYLDSPSIGSFTAQVSYDGPPSQAAGASVSFTGTQTGIGDSDSVGNSGDGSNTSMTLTTTSGDYVCSALFTDLGPSGTLTQAGTLIFEVEDISSDTDFNAQYVLASSSSTATSWTHSSTNRAAVALVVVSEAGAGATRPLFMQTSLQAVNRGSFF